MFMNILETKAYQKAFIRYLRKGTPIHLSLKAEALRYIWRTEQDARVRPSHAANNGKIFSMDNPPSTGNPGEDYNCRCWAEPMDGEQYVRQTLISAVNDSEYKWTDIDFWNHYTVRSGRPVTLQEIGHLSDVINYFANGVITSDGSRGGYQAVEEQIIRKAEKSTQGLLNYKFDRVYQFGSYWELVLLNGRYSLGESTIIGEFDGTVRKEQSEGKEYLVINGIISYEFKDEFSDPYEKIERAQILYDVTREEAERIVGDSADEDGEPYGITGQWQTKLSATVKME
jgi:hypothetical protein